MMPFSTLVKKVRNKIFGRQQNPLVRMVKKRLKDFQNRLIQGKSSTLDMILVAIVIVLSVRYLYKFYNWVSSVPEDKVEKWIERATACESKYLCVVVATFSISCCFWLLYLLHLITQHYERVTELMIKNLQAEMQIRLRDEMISQLERNREMHEASSHNII